MSVLDLEFSEKGLAFIAAKEACALTAYRDTSHLAIGFGQNIKTLKQGDTIEMQQAIDMFLVATAEYADYTRRLFRNYPFEQHHFDACGDVVYNIGPTKMKVETDFFKALDNYFNLIAKGPPQTDEQRETFLKIRSEAGNAFIPIMYKERNRHHNFERRCLDAVMFTAKAYGNISKLTFYDKGKRPKALRDENNKVILDEAGNVKFPPDVPVEIDMPVFKKAA